jgi:hypothetical protein
LADACGNEETSIINLKKVQINHLYLTIIKRYLSGRTKNSFLHVEDISTDIGVPFRILLGDGSQLVERIGVALEVHSQII